MSEVAFQTVIENGSRLLRTNTRFLFKSLIHHDHPLRTLYIPHVLLTWRPMVFTDPIHGIQGERRRRRVGSDVAEIALRGCTTASVEMQQQACAIQSWRDAMESKIDIHLDWPAVYWSKRNGRGEQDPKVQFGRWNHTHQGHQCSISG